MTGKCGLIKKALTLFCPFLGGSPVCSYLLSLSLSLQARLGDLTWPVVKSQVDDVIVVTEKEIVAAMKLIYERMKVRQAFIQRSSDR